MTDARPSGRRLLLAVLQRTRGIYVAARCRVHPSRVSRWVSGEDVPSPKARELLFANYGIPVDAWPTARERGLASVAKAERPL